MIDSLDFAGQGITISGSGLKFGPAIFDSNPAGPNALSPDPDLLVGLGNVLILQEDGTQSVPGIFDVPNDAFQGGALTLDFATAAELTSIDLIDIDSNALTRVFDVPSQWTTDLSMGGPMGYGTLDLTTLAPHPGVASVATASEMPGFDATGVIQLLIEVPAQPGSRTCSSASKSTKPPRP